MSNKFELHIIKIYVKILDTKIYFGQIYLLHLFVLIKIII